MTIIVHGEELSMLTHVCTMHPAYSGKRTLCNESEIIINMDFQVSMALMYLHIWQGNAEFSSNLLLVVLDKWVSRLLAILVSLRFRVLSEVVAF